MPMNRRHFIAAASAMALARPAAAGRYTDLIAAPGQAQLAPPEYDPTPIWGYGGAVPGPEIRVTQGGRVARRLINRLPQDTSVHWHGIRIANAMDGVAGMTQAAVPPGSTFDYGFEVPDAGTYWYHPHNKTWEQMARGLYGALIVEEPEPPQVDADEVLLIDDWLFDADATLFDSFGSLRDWSHGGRIGNWVTVNGDGDWQRGVEQGQRLRLRLVNTANARVFELQLRGFRAWEIALDGQPLSKPREITALTLAPAQRVDLIVDVTAAPGETAHILEPDAQGLLGVAAFPVAGLAREANRDAPPPLTPNPVPPLGDVETARRVPLRMEGGAMGGMAEAMSGGQVMSARDLAQTGKLWAFNGQVDMQDSPLIEAARGETIRIAMTNDTAWPHAMHLHGHHFRRLGPEGPGPLRDTLLVHRSETAEIAFVADNPGDWLLHCHMLEHAASGMMTWIRVS